MLCQAHMYQYTVMFRGHFTIADSVLSSQSLLLVLVFSSFSFFFVVLYLLMYGMDSFRLSSGKRSEFSGIFYGVSFYREK